MSILLTIYAVFLIAYLSLISFAFYRVLIFAQEKQLKGYSRRISLIVASIILCAILFNIAMIRQYRWDDNFSNLVGKHVFNKEDKVAVINSEKKPKEAPKEKEVQKKDSVSESDPNDIQANYNRNILKIIGIVKD